MFHVLIYWESDKVPRNTVSIVSAKDVLPRLDTIRAENRGYDSLVVTSDGAFLFSIDAAGNRRP